MIDPNSQTTDKRLKELREKEAEELAQTLSGHYGLPYLDLSKTAINTDALRLIPENEARQANVAAFKVVNKKLSLAILSPNKLEVLAIIKDLEAKNFKVEIFMVSEVSLESAWSRYSEISTSEKTKAGMIEVSEESISYLTEKCKTLTDIKTEIDKESELALTQGGISDILEVVLAGGLVTDASDIHIEPEQNTIRLRYRLDGVLQNVADFPLKIHRQIISRLKLLSGMKLNIKEAAQDGRFSIALKETKIEIRSSVIPSAYGESVVMRILNPKTIALTFDRLGIEAKLFEVFNREIHKPNGLILLTGPTGSGKTTTLYAFLREINSPENKVITIEDPIEYHLEGINQTQVNSKQGYTFLSGLRSALRQDPDVIMVGEIRDSETAKTAVQSALTGHLVFSTLHTNNAQGAIPRLIDLGVNPKIITSSLSLSIAQRLLRRLCQNCKKEVAVKNERDRKLLSEVIKSIMEKRPELVPSNWQGPLTEEAKIFVPVGCDQCNGIGYKGREGVFEAIAMDDAVAAKTIENPSEKEIKIAAKTQGILDMRQDGIIKVITGRTSLEELSRVVDLHEEII